MKGEAGTQIYQLHLLIFIGLTPDSVCVCMRTHTYVHTSMHAYTQILETFKYQEKNQRTASLFVHRGCPRAAYTGSPVLCALWGLNEFLTSVPY